MPISFDFLNLIESGSIKADLKIDGSRRIGVGLARGKIKIHIEDLDFVKLLLKIGNLLKSELALMDIETRKIGLLDGLKIFKGIAKDLAEANQTVIVVYEGKEILRIGEEAKPLLTGILFGRIEVVDKIKTIALFRGLITEAR
ncbi:MAG: hypothetical protein ACXQTJ_04770 [Candidatus Syntropharchaeales archaeon]